jgi:hypothetical protein
MNEKNKRADTEQEAVIVVVVAVVVVGYDQFNAHGILGSGYVTFFR